MVWPGMHEMFSTSWTWTAKTFVHSQPVSVPMGDVRVAVGVCSTLFAASARKPQLGKFSCDTLKKEEDQSLSSSSSS